MSDRPPPANIPTLTEVVSRPMPLRPAAPTPAATPAAPTPRPLETAPAGRAAASISSPAERTAVGPGSFESTAVLEGDQALPAQSGRASFGTAEAAPRPSPAAVAGAVPAWSSRSAETRPNDRRAVPPPATAASGVAAPPTATGSAVGAASPPPGAAAPALVVAPPPAALAVAPPSGPTPGAAGSAAPPAAAPLAPQSSAAASTLPTAAATSPSPSPASATSPPPSAAAGLPPPASAAPAAPAAALTKPPPGRLQNRAATPAAAAALPTASEGELVDRVLAHLQRQVDLALEVKLREVLTPLLTRASDNVVREARRELTTVMRELVARAISQELARRGKQP